MGISAITASETIWIRRVSVVVLLTFITRFVGFLYPVIVLRTLPVTAAGLAFFFISTGYFVVQPVSGGSATALIRPVAVAADDDSRARWLRAALSITVPGIVLCWVIGAVMCLTTSAPLLPMIVIVLGLSADIVYFQALTARRRYALAASYRLIANVAQLAALALAIAIGLWSVFVVVAIFSASYLVGFVIVEAKERVLFDLARQRVRSTAQQRRTLLRAAVPTALTGLAYSGITGFDTYLVRLTHGSLLPTYGAAKTLAAPLLLVSFAVTTIVQPEAASLSSGAAHALRRRMLIIAVPVVGTALLLAIGLAGPAIHLLYGARYPTAVVTFRWLAAGVAALSLYTLLQSWCYGRGRYGAPLISLAVGACTAIVTNLLLMPEFGAAGAGIGVLVGSSVAFLLLAMLTRDRRVAGSLAGGDPWVARPVAQIKRTITSASYFRQRLRLRTQAVGSHYMVLFLIALCLLAGFAVGTGAGVMAIGLLVILMGVVALVRRPLLGALILVSAVPALSGLDRGLPVPGFRLSEVLIVGIAIVTLITTRSDSWQKFDWIAVMYVLCTLLFGLFDLSGKGVGVSGEDLGKLIGPVEFVLLYRTVRSLARSSRDRRAIIRWTLLASIPVALLGLLQAVDIPGTRALAISYAGETDSLKTYHTYYRATALFSQGHLLAAYLMIVIVICVALLFDTRRTPLKRRVIAGIVCLDGIALMATATVTPVLGLIACLFALAYWYRRLGRAALVMVAVALVTVTAFGSIVSARYEQEFGQASANGGTPESLSFRTNLWSQEYLPTIDQHLLTGYGPELPPGAVWQFTESLYISLLLRGGLPLLLLYGGLMWLMGRQALDAHDDRRPIGRAMVVIILALIFMHTQENDFLNAGFPQVWWGMAGVLFAGTTFRMRAAMQRIAFYQPIPFELDLKENDMVAV